MKNSKQSMQQIIVTADDYGMCDAVDKAIDAGIENGIITTTNVMVNMESLENAGTLRQRYPDISIGLHWNVTTGRPVCAPSDIASLVNEDGVFYSIREFKKRYGKNLIKREHLEKELAAQYMLFEKVCGKPDYWNTHENSSLSLKTFKVYADMALKYGIDATRTFKRVYYYKVHIGFKKECREFLVKHFFNVWFSKIGKTFRMPSARVVSFNKISKVEGGGGTYLLNAIKRDGRNNIEVVVHPAITADSPYFGNISDERVKEYKFVTSTEIKTRFTENGIEFVNFTKL